MAEETPERRLNQNQWDALIARAQADPDALEDGAYVRAASDPDSGTTDLLFYAAALNKPSGWHFPFLESILDTRTRGAFVGLARRAPESGRVTFEVVLLAAADALRADYESAVSDMDQLAYEQAVDVAVRGTPSDHAWLESEFARLAALAQN